LKKSQTSDVFKAAQLASHRLGHVLRAARADSGDAQRFQAVLKQERRSLLCKTKTKCFVDVFGLNFDLQIDLRDLACQFPQVLSGTNITLETLCLFLFIIKIYYLSKIILIW
jgi:hypothetical protein